MSAVSDGGMNVYFPYLLVHPDARHHEIGRTLVRLMLVRYRDCRRKILVCPDSRVSFYKAAGWKTARDQTAILLSSLPEHGFTAEETAFTVEP
jgi:ribosomal protein S18 acetylase RimI-like enzyme